MNTINSFNFSKTLQDNSSQFQDRNPNDQELIAIIGFDFGTSSSKIIVQLPYYQGTPTFAVPFADFSDPSLQYLLPTKIFIDKDSKVCSLSRNNKTDIEIAAIKVGLMDSPNTPVNSVDGERVDIPVEYIATAYLALAIRYTRCWFIDSNTQYNDNYLKWSFNLGLPAAKDDQDEPRNSFEMAGKAAWIASLKSGFITIDSARESLNEIKADKNDFMIDFKVIPEVIAEVHGYNNSEFQRDGLHILIDVGAKTLDINSFLINREQNSYTILLADVDNFGAMVLHDNRIKAAESVCNEDKLQSHLKGLKLDDTTQIVPKHPKEYIPNDLDKMNMQSLLEALETEDNNFRRKKAFYNYVARMINLLREKKRPFEIKLHEKLDNLPVILCGGASTMPLYDDLVNKEINEWLEKFEAEGFSVRQIKLPKPDNLVADIANNDIHRFAVAYGLSFPEYEIGEYFRPSEIELERVPSYKEYDHIGPSQV